MSTVALGVFWGEQTAFVGGVSRGGIGWVTVSVGGLVASKRKREYGDYGEMGRCLPGRGGVM